MDLPGYNELLAARLVLNDEPLDRAKLLAAAEHVWGAMFHRDDWPPDLQKESDSLQPSLFKYGTIQTTAATMDDAEIADLQRALLAFLDLAERS